jgi:3-phenylpropionate/trans-cinnamate dioxygenase ferredoxin reductase subunit
MTGVVIVGAGQAGVQCADSLRQDGYEGAITILSDEPHLPYQRPPLSKAYLLGETDRARILLRPAAFYEQKSITLRSSVRAASIDRGEKRLRLQTGEDLSYDHLVLATGARPRPLPFEGANLDGVCDLRTLDDVDDIAQRLEKTEHVAVIGGGFIGLEFAAVARKLGKQVVVIEAQDRVMARVVPPELSLYFQQLHASNGVEIVTGAQVSALHGSDGIVQQVDIGGGRRIEAGLVVAGIGVIANVELAEDAGVECDNGIVVDEFARTNDPSIYAVGDCACYAHPFVEQRVRLESVQNAGDQARAAASAICGLNDKPYTGIPWFWSDQYEAKLQMAGLSIGCDDHVIRGSLEEGRFSVLHFKGDEFRSIAAVGRAIDYVQGRKLLEQGVSPNKTQAADPDFSLKTLL